VVTNLDDFATQPEYSVERGDGSPLRLDFSFAKPPFEASPAVVRTKRMAALAGAGRCSVCAAPTAGVCSGCGWARYCGRACARSDDAHQHGNVCRDEGEILTQLEDLAVEARRHPDYRAGLEDEFGTFAELRVWASHPYAALHAVTEVLAHITPRQRSGQDDVCFRTPEGVVSIRQLAEDPEAALAFLTMYHAVSFNNMVFDLLDGGIVPGCFPLHRAAARSAQTAVP